MTIVVLSSCSLTGEREDAMQLEGMMPKEDNATIDAMMKKLTKIMMLRKRKHQML